MYDKPCFTPIHTKKQKRNFVGLFQFRNVYILKGKRGLRTRTLWPFGLGQSVAFWVRALCSLEIDEEYSSKISVRTDQAESYDDLKD
jgi:hypothetical protein